MHQIIRTAVWIKHDGAVRLKEETELEENDLNYQRKRANTFTQSREMKMTDFNKKNREEG